MAATGYTPISLYYSTTAAAAPLNTSLVNGELAINITDGKLYYKDNAGVVQTIASKDANSGTFTNATVSGNVTLSGGTANGVLYLNGSKVATSGSALVFDGTNFSTTGTATATKLIPTGNVTAGNGMYLPTTNTLAWSTNGSEKMRLDSSGNLGIGTSSPSFSFGGGIEISNSTRANLKLNATGNVSELFMDSTSLYIDVRTSGNFIFRSGASPAERMRIDSSGNLGLGVTPSAWNSAYNVLQLGNAAAAWGGSSDVQTTLACNFYQDGSSANRYITNGVASFYQQRLGIHSWFTAPSGTAGNAITFTQVLAVEGGKSLALEGATSQTGTGITFPATQSACSDANTLDDYEEGTFTPTALGSSTAGTTTYVSQNGFYTKIGRQVTVIIRLRYSAMTGTGDLYIGNLPFTASNTSAMESVGTLMPQNLNWSGGTSVVTYIAPNTTVFNIYGIADDAVLTVQGCVNESADLWVTHTYFTS